MKKGLLWLRNDLRLADNPALHRALVECGEVLFVYVFDERTWNPNRMGPFRAQFQHESLSTLREKLPSGVEKSSLSGAGRSMKFPS